MRPVDYIALAIPIFFALIGVEWLCARWKREALYRLNDSVSDLSTGILDQVLGVFAKAITVGVYAWIWERFRVADWQLASGWTWVLCFLGVDFFYYRFHRVSHESNLPWGAHFVHHSSEEYNLSVALRQGALQSFWSFPFYLPLAWLGFPPLVDGPAGKYDRRASRPLTAYAMTQFVLATGATMALLWGEGALGWGAKTGLAVAIVWTVLDVGPIFDGRPWAVPSELLRLGALGAAVCAWAAVATTGAPFAAAVVSALGFGAVSAAWLLNHRRLLTASAAPAPLQAS